jgi:hypothetical protein
MTRRVTLHHGLGVQIGSVTKRAAKRAPEIPNSVGAEYIAGASCTELQAKYKTNWPHIRAKLVSLGTAIRPRGLPKGIARPDRWKVSETKRQQIGRLHNKGVPYPEIATRFGITRERVRQIVERLGLPKRFPVVAKRASLKRKQKAQERVEKAREMRGRIEAASELWGQRSLPTANGTLNLPGNESRSGPVKSMSQAPHLFPPIESFSPRRCE